MKPNTSNGTFTVADPAHIQPAIETLAELTEQMRRINEAARQFDSTPLRLGGYEINLSEYEVSDNPFIPQGHFVLIHRRLDALALAMPAALPDLIIISPSDKGDGSYTVTFVTQPRLPLMRCNESPDRFSNLFHMTARRALKA